MGWSTYCYSRRVMVTADGLGLPRGGGVVDGDQPDAPAAEDRVGQPPGLGRRGGDAGGRQADVVRAGGAGDDQAVVAVGAVAVRAVVAALVVLR